MDDSRDGPDDDSSLSVSRRIRARLLRAKRRFFANDNISDFIRPEETDELLEEVADKLTAVLESLVIELENDTKIGREHV